jgi:lipopolysaccharide transport system permease protein
MTSSDQIIEKNINSLRPSAVMKDRPMFRIAPTKGWTSLKLKELWEYRDLMGIFVWRDLKVRYRQTVIGVLWAIIQPFLTMVVFSVFFGGLAKIPSDNIPYPIFSFAALVPWTFFSNSINLASNSLVNSAEMIKKIYFPRLTMPIASMLAGLVDFLLAFVILIGMMIYYGFLPNQNILWFPFFLGLAMMTSL